MDNNAATRVVLYTSESVMTDALFLYIYAHLAAQPLDLRVVAVRDSGRRRRRGYRRVWKKICRVGFLRAIEIMTSMYWQRSLGRQDTVAIREGLQSLPQPSLRPQTEDVVYVPSVNGPEAVNTLRELAPDILVQAGAGILRRPIIATSRVAVLNMHHGIAPLIRGMNSIYWGLWENRPDWIGSTVHCVDEGIDTGRPLAYCHVLPVESGEGFASLFVRATQGGVVNLVRVVDQLSRGETIEITTPPGESVYRSTFSGWRMLLLRRRLRRMRRSNHFA